MSDEKTALSPELRDFLRLQRTFISDYTVKSPSVTDDQWLRTKLSTILSDRAPEDIRQIGDEIQTTIRIQNEKRKALNSAVSIGRSKISWFAKELLDCVTQGVSRQQSRSSLSWLDSVVKNANEALLKTFHTQSGEITPSLHLNEHIFESHPAPTFNPNEADQNGKYEDSDCNMFQLEDLAEGIGSQAEQASLLGMTIETGIDLVIKFFNGEKINGKEAILKILNAEDDTGLVMAVATVLKIAVEKGMIKCIAKGTSAATLVTIAYIAVENTKTLLLMADNKLTLREGLDRIARTTVSAVIGLATVAKGLPGGETVRAGFNIVLGPVGSALGGLIRGVVAEMSGPHVSNKICETSKTCSSSVISTIRSVAREAVNSVGGLAKLVRTGLNLLCR